MKTLTDRQARFVHEYLIDQNASAAAGRAGYSPKTRGVQAGRLMRDPLVREHIVLGLADLFARLKLNAVEVLKAQLRQAFLDPARLFDEQQRAIPLRLLDEETRGGLTVHYAMKDDGRQTLHVRQTPRHVALAVLQKRLDAFDKLQAETFACEVEEEPAQPAAAAAPPVPAGRPLSDLARRLLSEPVVEATGEAPVEASVDAAPALQAQAHAHASSPVEANTAVGESAKTIPAAKAAPAEDFDPDAPPSPHDPDYDFMKDPNALWGGRYTAWNKYQQEKRARELQERERQAALAQGLPPGARIGAGRTVPVRMEPGYNPPWHRNNRPEFAIGAGETYLD